MNENEKISMVCRVCMKTRTKGYRSLFEKFKDMSLSDHINILTNIKIKENDGLPDTICSTCFLELETAINFKEKCENANYILKRNILEKIIVNETSSNVLIKSKKDVTSDESDESNDGLSIPEVYLDYSCKDNESIAGKEDGKQPSEIHVQCHDCGSIFKSKCKLRVHWKNTHLKKFFICATCKRIFKTEKTYKSHIKAKNKTCTLVESGLINVIGIGKARMFACKQCDYKTKRLKDMDSHLVTHSGDRPYQCELCSKSFTQHSSLQAHKEMKHKKYKVEITCHFCGKFVKGRTQVYRHLKSHTEDKSPCPICKRMLTKKSLKPHMQRHSGSKTFTCEVCASTFFTHAELCNHRRIRHNEGTSIFKCDLCEYKSNRSDTMSRHKKNHIYGNVPCTTCGKFFPNIQKLTFHERIHFEEKKHSCPQCDAKFHKKDSVRKHLKKKHKPLPPATPKSISLDDKEEISIMVPQYSEVVEVASTPS